MATLTAAETKAAGEALDALFKIKCGRCKAKSPADTWTRTRVFGLLALGDYQCPRCDYAFRRQMRKNRKPWEKLVECIEIDTKL